MSAGGKEGGGKDEERMRLWVVLVEVVVEEMMGIVETVAAMETSLKWTTLTKDETRARR